MWPRQQRRQYFALFHIPNLLCIFSLAIITHTTVVVAQDIICKEDNDCRNGGICEILEKKGEEVLNFICVCPPNYSGEYCEDYCPEKCTKHGSCRPNSSIITPDNENQTVVGNNCVCHEHWTGDQCDIPFEICEDKTMCLHGGTCEKLVGSKMLVYRCNCPPEYSGPNCSINPDGENEFEYLKSKVEENREYNELKSFERKAVNFLNAQHNLTITIASVVVMLLLSYRCCNCRAKNNYTLNHLANMKHDTATAFDTEELSNGHDFDLI